MGIGKGNSPNSLKNLKPVKKGEVRNPHGARALQPEKRAMMKLTKEYLVEIIHVAAMHPIEALAEIVNDPKSPAIKVGVAKSLYDAIEGGDWEKIEQIIARIVGKIPDKLELTGAEADNNKIIVEFVSAAQKNNSET